MFAEQGHFLELVKIGGYKIHNTLIYMKCNDVSQSSKY